MKKKKLLYTLVLSAILIVSSLVMSVSSYAATTTTFGLQEFRKARTNGDQYGYKIGQQKVWKVVKYNNSTIDYDTGVYCLRAGYGFYTDTPGVFNADYNTSLNFKDKDSLSAQFNIHPDLGTNYKSVLWILDNAYIPTSSTAESDRAALLAAAGISSNSEITDDDIDVIQQLAIWYYTNTSEETYHKVFAGEPVLNTLSQKIMNNGVQIQDYLGIEDVNSYRYYDIEALYKYLVAEAGKTENLAQYDQNVAVAPVSLENTNPTAVYYEDESKFVVGPYKINKNNSMPYTLTAKFTDQNGDPLTGYQLLDSNKQATSKNINELIGQEFYISVPETIAETVTKINFSIDGSYTTTNMTYWTISGNNLAQPLVVIEKTPNSITGNNSVPITIVKKEFDLSLRKFISQVNNQTVNRQPVVDVTPLVNGTSTTAIYNHSKTPVAVKKGDIVTYTIRVYNEGEKDGYVGKITDYLPEELEFINDLTNYPEETKFNANNGWVIDSTNTRRISTTKLAYSSNAADATKNATNLLTAFNGTTLDYIDVQVKCKVKETATSTRKITNLAQITAATDAEGKEVTDRDSVPDGGFTLPSDTNLPSYKDTEINRGDSYIPGQEDDDDFEKLKVEEFDLSLRKFIVGVNNTQIIGREPVVDVTPLVNKTSTTAIYNHTKKPVDVQIGDTVTYTIRVYNEAEIDGYANEIVDHLPEELEFLPNDELNQKYEWEVSEDGRTVTTKYLSIEKETSSRINILAAFNGEVLDYKDVQIKCKVKNSAKFNKKLTNLAEITECKDNTGNTIIDRDSEPENMVIPSDEELPSYKDDEIESGDKYIPGQEDDDDFEKVRIVYFDLALRKFITGVNDTEVTSRIPQISMGEDGNLKYDHTKDPVEVQNGDIVTYTLRIFNEGLMNGYASEVVDDVPEGLIFLPEDETNIGYRWVMYKEVEEKAEDTESVDDESQDITVEDEEDVEIFVYGDKKYVETDIAEEADLIMTDYLSKEQEKTSGANLIKAFDPEKEISDSNPDYRDLKINFKVTEPNTSDRIIINTAEISDDRDETNEPVDDIDSTPGNDNEWGDEDDLDKEFIKVKYFDLALKKWVSKVILIENGEQTVTDTGHTGEEDPEPVVKVDLHRKKLNAVTVKFEFQIKVTNEGEIAGYAKEVTDYIPEGLEFIQEDNPDWYTREALNGRERVATKALENTLLQPGESANVPIILTWINDSENMGLKTNIAEISKDYNDSLTPDIDSTPDNFIDGEDDQDDAPVMLAIELGQTRIYFGLIFTVLATTAIGIFLIKKFVL